MLRTAADLRPRKRGRTAAKALFSTLAPQVTMSVRPRGVRLFEQGDDPDGVYYIFSGRVRLTVISETGRALTIRNAGQGDLLGMGPLFSGRTHQATAEVTRSARVGFIGKKDLLRLLSESSDGRFHVLHLLSEDVSNCRDAIRTYGSAA